jgi:hypothetical protein
MEIGGDSVDGLVQPVRRRQRCDFLRHDSPIVYRPFSYSVVETYFRL